MIRLFNYFLSVEVCHIVNYLMTHTLRCILQDGVQEYCQNVHSTVNVYMTTTWLKHMCFPQGYRGPMNYDIPFPANQVGP